MAVKNINFADLLSHVGALSQLSGAQEASKAVRDIDAEIKRDAAGKQAEQRRLLMEGLAAEKAHRMRAQQAGAFGSMLGSLAGDTLGLFAKAEKEGKKYGETGADALKGYCYRGTRGLDPTSETHSFGAALRDLGFW